MKRSAMPRRSKPMRRSAMKRGPGAKALREADALDEFRRAVHARRFCEISSPDCPPGVHEGCDAHHVWPSDRDRGVHDPARGLLLCRTAHSWVHANPSEADERGWLRRHGDDSPVGIKR